ncbi:MAG: hypothetical protein CMF13_08540 [Idiomarina sp.]|nr:hypothetical protein [Idiomarina sp.]
MRRMSLCLLMFSLFAASAVSHAEQYEFPKDIGKKNKPFEQCNAVNANSGGVSITCPGSVFTALNGSDEIRFKKTSKAELIITGNTVIKSTINNKQSIPLLLRFQTQNSVKIDASSTIKADIFANGSITSDGVIDGNLYTDKDLINNRIINGNVDAEGNIRNNGSGVINGSINVDGDLWNDGQINGTYANAKCTDSSQSNACGNKPLNVDETCNINANEGPCTGGNNVGYQLVGDWHFDESSWTGEPGEVLNSASSSLSGTAVGQPTTSSFSPAIAGNIGTCRYGRFGGDDFVRVPQPQQLSASESVSLSMWFNISASAQRSSSERYQTLLIYGEGPTEGPNGRFEVYRRVSDGALYFEIRDSLDRIHNVSVPGQQVFDGNWHHIAATYDAQSDDINLYIDGVLKATAGVSNRSLNPLSSRANLYIGGQSFAGHGVNGSIDEVTVATGVYSSQKVNQLFNRSRPCGAVDTLKQCSDIWDQALTSGNNSLVNIRPDVPPYGQQLPRTLDPIDYLRQGSFANVGEDYQAPAPTSRVYIDGSLTIEQGARLNQNDDADNFMLIVNGDLTIERDVRINGYIYATGDIFLANAGEPWVLVCFEANTSIVNGALAAAGDIYQTGCGQPAQINYQQPGVDIQGGGYCTVGTAAPLQPILQWSMNDGPWTTNTDVLDGSKNLLNGQAKQGLEWQQASASSALPVDENGMGTCGYGYFKRSAKQYIELPDDPVLDLTNEYTIALWARYSTTPDSGLMTLVSKDTNYELHVTSSGQINWWWQGQRGVHSLTSTQRFDDGEWHYVVARFKSGKQTLTVDNEVIIDASINDKPTTNNSSLRLGADKEGDGNRFFDGAIDEFQMFDSYLSGNDIKRLMDQRSVCQASGNQCYSLNMAGQVFGNDWLSYSKDENYSPKLVEAHNEQYLELTDNQNNRATAVTLQKAFPGKGHRIEIEFKLYAWGSQSPGFTGADGIALVLSDASRISNGNPRAGSYGGSLGYAQRNGGVPGFQAGWLGIGFDEYGNFSRNSEGRAGGFDRLVPNRVGVRGADSTNYKFLRASNELDPAIDSPANQNPNSVFNPKPGHTYKVLIDGTGDNPSIEVLRKLDENGANNNFVSILKLDNIQDQPQMPEQVYLSFTGSTGGETNYHWIKDLSVCSIPGSPNEQDVHHYQLAFNQNAVLCNGAEVAVKACANADCSETFNRPASIELGTDNGNFSPSSLSWQATSSQLLTQLNPTQAGVSNLSVTNQSSPQPANPTVCLVDGVVDDCQIAISNAGFVFYDAGLQSTQLPRQTAGIQSGGITIRAVETNTSTLQCQALTNNLTQVEMQLECVDPNQCRSESEYLVSGQVGSELTAANATDLIAGNYQNVAVEFNDSIANLAMKYDDVGAVRLSAKATLSNGVTLRGDSNTFVWQPHHINMQSSQLDTDLSSSTEILAKAGDSFKVELTARNAQDKITPNFGLEQVAERLIIQETATAAPPVANNDGSLENGAQFSRSALGTFTNGQVTYSEVGNANIIAQVAQQNGGGYLSQWQDTSDLLETPFVVGRFIPHHFTLEAGTGFANTCGAQPSYYIGEPQSLLPIQLVARNASGNITRNYASDLAKAFLEFAAFNVNGQSFNLRVTPNAQGSSLVGPIDWDDSAGNWGYGSLNNAQATFLRSDAEEGPYENYTLGIRINDGEGDHYYSRLENTGLSAPADDDYVDADYAAFDSARLVFARMVLNNVASAISDPLLIQGHVEFWNGNEYQLDENNNCYTVANNAFSEERYVVEEGAETPNVDLELGQIADTNDDSVTLSGGRIQSVERGDDESLRWLPAGENLQFEFDLKVPPHLQYDWTGDGVYDENPTALGIFGIYSGSDRQIYWQEVGL